MHISQDPFETTEATVGISSLEEFSPTALEMLREEKGGEGRKIKNEVIDSRVRELTALSWGSQARTTAASLALNLPLKCHLTRAATVTNKLALVELD